MNKIKQIPQFKNEGEEINFWDNHSLVDYIDSFKKVNLELPNLKPSTKNISLRMTESMYLQLKQLANKKDVPYQSLVKIFLDERIKEEYSDLK